MLRMRICVFIFHVLRRAAYNILVNFYHSDARRSDVCAKGRQAIMGERVVSRLS